MPIPSYHSIMLPLLKFIGDGQIHWINEIEKHLSKVFNLNEQEKKTLDTTRQVEVLWERIMTSIDYP